MNQVPVELQQLLLPLIHRDLYLLALVVRFCFEFHLSQPSTLPQMLDMDLMMDLGIGIQFALPLD